jgi:hypothetical protein
VLAPELPPATALGGRSVESGDRLVSLLELGAGVAELPGQVAILTAEGFELAQRFEDDWRLVVGDNWWGDVRLGIAPWWGVTSAQGVELPLCDQPASTVFLADELAAAEPLTDRRLVDAQVGGGVARSQQAQLVGHRRMVVEQGGASNGG